MAMKTIAVLVGGGPAPGINGVIAAVTNAASARGIQTLGVLDGFSRLMKGDAKAARQLVPAEVEGIERRGGSVLYTSRANPANDPEALSNVVKTLASLGAGGLVTIGGDDTATSAAKVARGSGGLLRVAHVPKTIDNDLPLPPGVPTFGFETARLLGTELARNLVEDARTTRRFYLVTVMGRSAGHLAVGIGHSCGAILTLIPEEFGSRIRLGEIVDRVEIAIAKRVAGGTPYGVVVLAEGLIEKLDPSELASLQNIERDEHGNPRMSEISLGKIVKDTLAPRLASRGKKPTFVAKELGYELRCADPCAYDVAYATTLGAAAVEFLSNGTGDAMITVQEGRAVPVPFESILDPATNKARVRRIDVRQESYRHLRRLEARLFREDLEVSRLQVLASAVGEKPEPFLVRLGPLAEERT